MMKSKRGVSGPIWILVVIIILLMFTFFYTQGTLKLFSKQGKSIDNTITRVDDGLNNLHDSDRDNDGILDTFDNCIASAENNCDETG